MHRYFRAVTSIRRHSPTKAKHRRFVEPKNAAENDFHQAPFFSTLTALVLLVFFGSNHHMTFARGREQAWDMVRAGDSESQSTAMRLKEVEWRQVTAESETQFVSGKRRSEIDAVHTCHLTVIYTPPSCRYSLLSPSIAAWFQPFFAISSFHRNVAGRRPITPSISIIVSVQPL